MDKYNILWLLSGKYNVNIKKNTAERLQKKRNAKQTKSNIFSCIKEKKTWV